MDRGPSRQIRVIRHESAAGGWETAVGRPSPELRGLVTEYVGWFETRFTPGVRRELPSNTIPLIVNFGAHYRMSDGGEPRWCERRSFTSGAYDRFVLVESTGPSGGLQVNFTILGARLFFGRPIADLANRTVDLDDMLGADASRLEERLRAAPDWDLRFDIIDREIGRRLSSAAPVPPGVRHAWDRLTTSGGSVRIGTLVDELGCSQRHLIETFTAQFGLPPKIMGRVLRFDRAVRIIEGGRASSLAAVAQQCGYYDQAHFARDARQLAGASPSDLVQSLLPDRGGFAVDR